MEPDFLSQKEMSHKRIIEEYFKLVETGKFKEGLMFFRQTAKLTIPSLLAIQRL